MVKVLSRAFMALLLLWFSNVSASASAHENEVLVCDEISKQHDIAYVYARSIVVSTLEYDDVSYLDSQESAEWSVAYEKSDACAYFDESSVEFIDSDECVTFLSDWCLVIDYVSYTDLFGEEHKGFVIPKSMYENIEGLSFSNESFRRKIVIHYIALESLKLFRHIARMVTSPRCETQTVEATTFILDDGICYSAQFVD